MSWILNPFFGSPSIHGILKRTQASLHASVIPTAEDETDAVCASLLYGLERWDRRDLADSEHIARGGQ